MRFVPVGFWLLVWFCSCVSMQAGSAMILKVLPQYLDERGRHALSPSLYERDAYQDFLRKNPTHRSALRFAVNWKAKKTGTEKLVLRLELRTSGRSPDQPIVLEQVVKPTHFFSRWSSLRLAEEEYKEFGDLIAWRASLWQGGQMLTSARSFLW